MSNLTAQETRQAIRDFRAHPLRDIVRAANGQTTQVVADWLSERLTDEEALGIPLSTISLHIALDRAFDAWLAAQMGLELSRKEEAR